jgi:hypothetical protein
MGANESASQGVTVQRPWYYKLRQVVNSKLGMHVTLFFKKKKEKGSRPNQHL